MNLEEEIKGFNKLVSKASEIHPYTWCVKRQSAIHTASLTGEECCSCKEYVWREGVCDPL